MNENQIALIVGSVIVIILGYFQNRKSENLKGLISTMKDMIMDNGNDIAILKESKLKTEKEHSFRQSFKSDIAENVSIKVNVDKLLNENMAVESAMISYFNDIPDYAFSFFYSDMRSNVRIAKIDFKNMLSSKLNSLMYSYIYALQNAVMVEKCYLQGKNIQMVLFTEYIAEITTDEGYNLFQLNKRLVNKLVDNGIDEDKLREIFVNYTAAFIDRFKKTYSSFLELKDYDEEIENLLE